MRHLSRRRFLTISAASAVFPTMSSAISARWQGSALGATATMRIDGLGADDAAPVFAAVESELARLEEVFSLYRPNSEISRLNRDGRIDYPSADLLDVLSLSASLYAATDGAFDPTVQPLWLALARGDGPAKIRHARRQVGFERLKFDAESVFFSEPRETGPFAVTLNGIAQGAISDRIAALLRRQGLTNVLIDMGEITALGHRPDGAPWRVGVTDENGALLRNVSLSDRAIATSSSHGTMINASLGHIVDPRNPRPAAPRTVSVSARQAAVADGLSTALCLVPTQVAHRFVGRFPEAHLEVLHN